MARATQFLSWTTCRGRDGWSAPQDVAPDMAVEALNVHFYEGGLATKRGGETATGTLTGFTGPLTAMTSWVPGQVVTAREFFAVDSSATTKIGRMAAGSTLTNLTLKDNVATAPTQVTFAGLNGKLFLGYDSTVNRLHVFDPGLSTSEIRRAGMATAVAPSVANTGSGSYAATLRYYRVAFTEQRSGVTVRRGNLGAAASFTPSGTGTHARITKPTAVTEGETHWEVYASSDGVTYYGPLATTAVGTTTYDDNTSVSAYATTYELAPEEGANTPFPSCKFLYSNGTRLFGLGVWESTAGDAHPPQSGTVYFTPALDSSGVQDDERCSATTSTVGRLLLARNAGATDRGLSGLGNMILAFQDSAIFALTPTENAETPYRRVQYSDRIGAVSHQSIVQAEDELGRPCVYFLDPVQGPYKLGQDGLRWVGKDVKDIWDTFAPGATTVAAHGVYYPAKRQVWWWIATGGATAPTEMIVLNVSEQRPDAYGDLRGGWARWSGDICLAVCSTLMSATLGATMSVDLKPYFNHPGTYLLKGDTGTQDNGVSYQAYVESGALTVDPIIQRKQVLRSWLLAEVASGVTIRETLIRNFGDQTNQTFDKLITAAGSETRVLVPFTDTSLQDVLTMQVRLGDSAASSAAWTLDRWIGEVKGHEVS